MSEASATPVAPRWAAVIVSYEPGELLERCVRSVLDDQTAGAPDIVVVDNASTDGAAAALAASTMPVRVVHAGSNLGYARAANLGVAATTAPVVAVLNPDTLLRPGSADRLVSRLEREPELGAIGPRIENPDGSVYPSARAVPSPGDALGHAVFGFVWKSNPWTRRYRELDADAQRPRDVAWVSGAAIWLRRSALDSVGGWDGRYFMYVEDLDLCWRLGRAGWRVAYEPGALVAHVQGASTARHPYRMTVEHHRSAFRFARRRLTGWRVVLVPLAAVVFTVRAGVALAVRAVSARAGGRRVSG